MTICICTYIIICLQAAASLFLFPSFITWMCVLCSGGWILFRLFAWLCNGTSWRRCHGHMAPYVHAAVEIDDGRATAIGLKVQGPKQSFSYSAFFFLSFFRSFRNRLNTAFWFLWIGVALRPSYWPNRTDPSTSNDQLTTTNQPIQHKHSEGSTNGWQLSIRAVFTDAYHNEAEKLNTEKDLWFQPGTRSIQR